MIMERIGTQRAPRTGGDGSARGYRRGEIRMRMPQANLVMVMATMRKVRRRRWRARSWWRGTMCGGGISSRTCPRGRARARFVPEECLTVAPIPLFPPMPVVDLPRSPPLFFPILAFSCAHSLVLFYSDTLLTIRISVSTPLPYVHSRTRTTHPHVFLHIPLQSLITFPGGAKNKFWSTKKGKRPCREM